MGRFFKSEKLTLFRGHLTRFYLRVVTGQNFVKLKSVISSKTTTLDAEMFSSQASRLKAQMTDDREIGVSR